MNILILLVFPAAFCLVDIAWEYWGGPEHAELFSAVFSAWVIAWGACLFVHLLYTARTACELAF